VRHLVALSGMYICYV